jgi:hypothetical protein
MSERIGDATRDMWAEFLGHALAKGFLDQEEFERRYEMVIHAATLKELNDPLDDLPYQEWHKHYRKLRRKGLRARPGLMIPAVTGRMMTSRQESVLLTWLILAHLVITVLVIFVLLGI